MQEFEDANKIVEDRLNVAFTRLKTSVKDGRIPEIETSARAFVRDCIEGNTPLEMMQGRMVKLFRSLYGIDTPSNHDYLSTAFDLLKLRINKENIPGQKLNLMQPRLLDSQLGKQQFRIDDSISESVDEEEANWKRAIKKIENDPDAIQDIVDEVDDLEDIADEYQDDELILDEDVLEEGLSRAARLKKKIDFNKTKSKRERAKSIALKRMSSQAGLEKKARRLAIKLLKEKIAKKPLSKMSVQEKERLEKIVSGSKDLVRRLSTRLASRIRKIEQARISKKKISEATVAHNIKKNSSFDADPKIFDMNHVRKHGMLDEEGMKPIEIGLGTVNGLNLSLIKEKGLEAAHIVSHDENSRVHHVIELGNQRGYHIGAIQEGAIFKNQEIPKAEQRAKMSDIYSHLIKRGHIIVSDDMHSHGGLHVWRELARNPHVSVHGFNPETNELVNTDEHLEDISDSHYDVKDHDGTDISDSSQYKAWMMDAEKKSVRLIASPKVGKLRTSIAEAMISKNIDKKHDVGLGHVWIDGIHGFRDYAGLFSKERDLGKIGEHTNVSMFEEPRNNKPQGYIVSHDANGDIHHVIQYRRHPTEPDTLMIDAVAKNPRAYHEIKAHDLYHHLISNHGFTLHSDSSVSEGAKKVWEHLSKMPGVKVHGLDRIGQGYDSMIASKS